MGRHERKPLTVPRPLVLRIAEQLRGVNLHPAEAALLRELVDSRNLSSSYRVQYIAGRNDDGVSSVA